MQQGTVPLEGRGPLLFSLLKYPTEEARQTALAAYQEATASVRSFAPQATWEAVRDAFARGFSAALGVPFEPMPLTAAERELAEELAATKYALLDWKQLAASAPQSAH